MFGILFTVVGGLLVLILLFYLTRAVRNTAYLILDFCDGYIAIDPIGPFGVVTGVALGCGVVTAGVMLCYSVPWYAALTVLVLTTALVSSVVIQVGVDFRMKFICSSLHRTSIYRDSLMIQLRFPLPGEGIRRGTKEVLKVKTLNGLQVLGGFAFFLLILFLGVVTLPLWGPYAFIAVGTVVPLFSSKAGILALAAVIVLGYSTLLLIVSIRKGMFSNDLYTRDDDGRVKLTEGLD